VSFWRFSRITPAHIFPPNGRNRWSTCQYRFPHLPSPWDLQTLQQFEKGHSMFSKCSSRSITAEFGAVGPRAITWSHQLRAATAAWSQGCRRGISVCRKLCIPWHSFLRLPHIPFVWGIRKFNPTVSQLPKIEAIQISLFVDVSDVLVIVFIRNASTSKSKSISEWFSHSL